MQTYLAALLLGLPLILWRPLVLSLLSARDIALLCPRLVAVLRPLSLRCQFSQSQSLEVLEAEVLRVAVGVDASPVLFIR